MPDQTLKTETSVVDLTKMDPARIDGMLLEAQTQRDIANGRAIMLAADVAVARRDLAAMTETAKVKYEEWKAIKDKYEPEPPPAEPVTQPGSTGE